MMRTPAAHLKLMLSFAVGSLLGDVFCHLLPEVWAYMDRDDHKAHIRIGLWVIVGLLFFLIVEKLAGDETEFEPVSGYLNLFANVVDNFTHGLAVAGSFLVSARVGTLTTLAILLHEVPHEVGDFAILLRSGFDRWKAAKAQFLTATGGVFGALTALTAESAQLAGERTAWILPFTSGGFLYIALVTVVPDLLQERHWRQSVVIKE
nr:hypothetical protein BaRGS_009852 [Batillaria attramentaria]